MIYIERESSKSKIWSADSLCNITWTSLGECEWDWECRLENLCLKKHPLQLHVTLLPPQLLILTISLTSSVGHRGLSLLENSLLIFLPPPPLLLPLTSIPKFFGFRPRNSCFPPEGPAVSCLPSGSRRPGARDSTATCLRPAMGASRGSGRSPNPSPIPRPCWVRRSWVRSARRTVKTWRCLLLLPSSGTVPVFNCFWFQFCLSDVYALVVRL